MDGEDVRVARWAALLPSLVAHDEYADVEREDEDVNDEEGSGDVQGEQGEVLGGVRGGSEQHGWQSSRKQRVSIGQCQYISHWNIISRNMMQAVAANLTLS